ncbi:unnamed protein product [Prorocentrum cordatum]|uniref:Copia protein n=1 Tax=Prorocentrum cordatum TaxID=2364126 RepID=A0ABN9SVJ9_9DINO|nr:unnamed protein product [Polarella glacialis]
MKEEHRGDKVPGWDGDPKTWRTYRRKALQYQEGTKRQNRYLCGPRLEARLTGRAEVAAERCKSGWLSIDDGVERLLAWLERRCSRQAVPDVGQELETFLIKPRRRKLEPMQQWTDRFETGYQYLRRALARALGHLTQSPHSTSSWTPRPWRWVEVEKEEDDEGPSWTWEYTDGRGEDDTGSRTWSITNDDDAEEELDDMPEVFPSIVWGWLMLARAGLDSKERSAIMTATGGSLEASTIREKLITTWEDDDLAERDGHARYPKAYTAQIGDDDRTWLDEDHVEQGAGSFAAEQECEEFDEEHDMAEANDEEIEAYMAAQQEEAEALAALHTAKRTLRQVVKQTVVAEELAENSQRDLAGRWAANTEASAKMATRTKELKFNLVAARVAEQESGDSPSEAMFAEQAILEGKGIVDLGCTDTMGGERALDIVARKNLEKYGDTRLREVNRSYQPVYSFGNGEKERAYGQVKFGITGAGNEGDIAINGFAKDVPILVSKKVLKKLGAVIDCDTGVAVFVKLAPNIPVQLEESPDGGHYCMSLVDDILEHRVQDPARLQNFRRISQHVSEWGRPDTAAAVGQVQFGGASPRWGVPASRREVHHLHKAEAVELIRELGLPFSPAWSVDELRHTIKETLFPKAESASQNALKGVSTMKKPELVQKAEEIGAHLTPNMTNAAMKTKPEATDIMGFGKHRTLTYRQVWIQCPSYAEWAKKETSTESSWELTRFVSWLNAGAPRGTEGSEFRGQFSRSGAQSEWSGRGLNHVKELDPRKQRWLAKCIRESNSTEDFEALMAHGGVKLMELACSPASILSSKMAEKFGEEAVQRVSSWNGHKLGTAPGNQKARETRDKAEPDHLWISTRCGPLSTLTLGFNFSNPARAEATRKRRLQAIKEYKGAVQLVYDQVAQGKHAHWEWPIKCEGWGHAMIRKMIDDCSMTVVKVAGCQLGVKNEKGEPLLKEWLIATTSPKMAARMATECPGDHRHGELMGGSPTASTSYHTDEFARRAVRAMIEEAAPDYHELPRSMSQENETDRHALAGQQESTSPAADPGSKEYQKITASMLNALKRKGVSPMVMRVAQDFHCEACEEANNHRPTHPPVSLEAIPPKWKQIQADQFEWEHPQTKLKAKFSLIIDENCKARVTKILYHMVGQDRHRNPVWADLKSFYEERWLPYFGKPQRVKVDPEGSWMSKQAAQYFDSDSIGYEPIPGQAHWHISLAEEAIQATKGTMDKLVTENPDMSTEEALARGTAAGNSREDVRGHSPLQHALGRAPDLDGHFFESDFDELPYVEAQRVDKEYGENYMRMYAAEQEYLRQVYLRRLSRAEKAKNQLLKAVAPGMWVRYFHKEKGEVKGRFKGLARVLAAETTRPVDGDLVANQTLHPGRAGPVVWLVRAGRIIKVDLCQVGAASAREIAYAELMAGKDTPWTVNPFMNQAMRQEYLDFSGHDPTEQDEELASWEGVPEPAPPAKRTRHEEPPKETKSERNHNPVLKAIRKKDPPPGGVASIVKAARAAQAEDLMMERAALMAKASPDAWSFRARQGTFLEISVELPLAGKPLKQATRPLSTYMAGQLKRGKREISERALTPEEVKKFSVAKATEVNNYVISSVLESLPPGVTPQPEDVMRTRWILEWKMDEATSEKKPKARIVVLDYMDPEHEHRPTTAPTMTRTSSKVPVFGFG